MASNPTASLHRFDDSLTVEARWAPTLDTWFHATYPLRVATDAEQRQGIDRVAIDDTGEIVTLDYKCDERAVRTGNVFIETVSNETTGRPGWALTSTATWLVYFVAPHRVLMFLMRRLRQRLPDWRRDFPERAARNLHYRTLGVCVPLAVAEAATEYVGHLDLRDGPVLQPRDERPLYD